MRSEGHHCAAQSRLTQQPDAVAASANAPDGVGRIRPAADPADRPRRIQSAADTARSWHQLLGHASFPGWCFSDGRVLVLFRLKRGDFLICRLLTFDAEIIHRGIQLFF